MKRYLALGVLLGALALAPLQGQAQTKSELIAQLQALMAQLQSRLAELQSSPPATAPVGNQKKISLTASIDEHNDRVHLSWSPRPSIRENYAIYRSTQANPDSWGQPLKWVSDYSINYLDYYPDTTAAPGVNYYYLIKSFLNGEETQSNVAHGRRRSADRSGGAPQSPTSPTTPSVPTTPSTPQTVTVRDITTGCDNGQPIMTSSWSGSPDPATGKYTAYLVPGSSYDGSSNYYSYTTANDSVRSTWMKHAQSGATAVLTPGSTYQFWVYNGAYSPAKSFVAPSCAATQAGRQTATVLTPLQSLLEVLGLK